MTAELDRRRMMQMSLIAAAATSLPLGAFAQDDPIHDFDSHMGRWHAQHRRLKARLAGSTEWLEFDGTCDMGPMLGGQANMDDNVFNMPGGAYRGVTLRAYDPKTRQWSIWWLDGRFPEKIDVPVVGGFKDGIGTFLADDTFDGKPIKVRFLWSRITPNSRRWEQAFSPDEGKSWETNWTTDFTRIA